MKGFTPFTKKDKPSWWDRVKAQFTDQTDVRKKLNRLEWKEQAKRSGAK